MYYDDGSDVLLGRTDGNCIKSRNYPQRLQKDPPDRTFSIPSAPAGSPGPGTHYYKHHRQCAGARATPAGLKAMEELGKLEDDRRKGRMPGPIRKKGIASNEMCTFLIINISSLQLIPVNVIAFRSQYGSVNPAGIVGAGILATTASTLAAVLYCKVMDGKRRA